MAASNNHGTALESTSDFINESAKFLNKCSKPDSREYFGIVRAVGTGFLFMGLLGFAVKLVHIPIRHFITV